LNVRFGLRADVQNGYARFQLNGNVSDGSGEWAGKQTFWHVQFPATEP